MRGLKKGVLSFLPEEDDETYHARYTEINYGRNRFERRRDDKVDRRKKTQNRMKSKLRKAHKRTNKRPAGN